LEQGFPGNLNQKIRYTLTEKNEVKIEYNMVSDKTTVINPTNHTYFNLMGHNSGSITDHVLTVYADAFLPINDTLIPTGEERSVEGTPFDFREPRMVGEQIDQDYEPLNFAGGYDHNFCFANDGVLKKVAKLQSPDGVVGLTVFTDLCGMQLYTGNFLNGIKGKQGAIYGYRNGLCLETQFYPNACNTPSFVSSVKAAGDVFQSRTTYQFDF
jgi:aldose 1-epimerase